MMTGPSSSPWDEFVMAAYRQTAVRLRDALGDDWFEQGVEPHIEDNERRFVRDLFEGKVSNDAGHPGTNIERLQQIITGNWAAFAAGFGDDLRAAERELERLTLIAAEVAVKHGVLPANVIEDFKRLGRALLEGLGSPVADDIERIAERFPREGLEEREQAERDKAVADTFPASDPPAASNPSTRVGPPDE